MVVIGLISNKMIIPELTGYIYIDFVWVVLLDINWEQTGYKIYWMTL